MAYRTDADLEFLQRCDNEDLEILVDYITKGKNGQTRLTEELTTNSRYIANQPNHKAYWDLIGAEVQCFGANSIATLFRGGEGVLYKEVLTDVCKKMKVNFNKDSSVETIETNLMLKVLTDSLEKMSADELKEIVNSLKLKTTDFTKQAVITALQLAIKQGGFLSYQIALIVANAIAKMILGHGLKLAMNASLVRAMSVFAGPIGWAITAVWTLVDLAGPAYRVTIPAVIQIAYMRAKLAQADQEAKQARNEDEADGGYVITQCPHCSQKNRVHIAKIASASCGSCKGKLALAQ